MKSSPLMLFLLGALAGAISARAETGGALEVHEWGTFTIVSGSDGEAIQWFQPRKTLAKLPAFVIPKGQSVDSSLARSNQLRKSGSGTLTLSPPAPEQAPDVDELPAFVLPQDQIRPASIFGFAVAGKTGTATRWASHGFFVRMETPVIYFYPEKAMRVSVDVSMRRGHITEWFPPLEAGGTNGLTHWAGDLASPADPAGAARLLPVDGARGARYARAREVPDAWFFHAAAGERAATATTSRTPALPAAPEAWEKFIFYRGAGDELPPYRVEALQKNAVRLSHYGDGGEIRAALLLQVNDSGARWARIDPLPAMTNNWGPRFADGSLNTPVGALPKAQEELGIAMRTALVEAGLTADEAKAMVATWGDSWFSETGTRVLAILPRTWVDSALPLSITPAPSKLARVFVARFEVFTPEREQALLGLLGTGETPSIDTLEKFRGLRLGRFATAALERTRRLADQRMRTVFTELEAASSTPRVSP